MSSSFLVRGAMVVLVAFSAALPFSPVPAAAQSLNLSVDCAAGQTIGAALAQSQGNTGPVTITISGTCVEAVAISRNDVTIQGSAPTDGLQAPNPATGALISVSGQRINLTNLTLTGGQRGVLAASGGTFFGNHLTVTGTQLAGIEIGPGGTGGVFNSSIDQNANTGVSANSTGYLAVQNCDVSNNGFRGVGLNGGRIDLVNSTVSNNNGGIQGSSGGAVTLFGSTVNNNTGNGILMISNSTVQLDRGSTISGNTGSGMELWVGSVALLASVTISGNRSDGVLLLAGSNVQLNNGLVIQGNHGNGIFAQDTGVIFTLQGASVPSVQITQNTGWGVLCAGPPAVAQISTRGQPALTGTSVFGNTQGQINCPGSPLVP